MTNNSYAQIEFTSITNETTPGANDGAIDLTASGNTGPFTFDWSNGATTEDISGLSAGNYCVTVYNSVGCDTTLCAMVDVCPDITLLDFTQPTCQGTSQGSAYIFPIGGNSPYTFDWDNGNTGQWVTGLSAGEHCVTVTDANGCQGSGCIEIEENDIGMKQAVKPACGSESDGSINIGPGGGSSPYSFQWSNGATTEDLNNIPSGVYSVTVTDAIGCTAVRWFWVGSSTPVNFTGTTSAACNGSGGSVTLSGVTGTAPISYQWSNGATTQNLNNVSAGTYCVTVTSGNNCTKEECFTVSNSFLNVVVTDKQNIAFCGDFGPGGFNQGSITVQAQGGTGPYTYSWSGPNGYSSSSSTASNITDTGNYTVTVTDANGCTRTKTVYICCCEADFEPTEPGSPGDPGGTPCTEDGWTTPITLSGNVTPVSGSGANDGAINLNVSGGLGSPIYNWTGPSGFTASTQDISGLAPGTYCVTVSDGCSNRSKCFTIADCSVSSPSISASTSPICQGAFSGSVNLNVWGGNSPYSYAWSNGSSSQDITVSSGGNYCVTVTDDSGCQATGCWTVNSYPVETQYDYSNCNINLVCNGQVLASESQYYLDVSPLDCRYYAVFCGLTGNVVDYYYQYAGTYYDSDYSSSCVVYERCSLTGQIYEVHNGYNDTYIDSGQTCSNCFYCFEVYVCVFPSLDYAYYAYDQTSILGISFVPSSACPSGQCLNTVYCNGSIMAQFCGSCSGFAPDGNDDGATTSFNKDEEPRIQPLEDGLSLEEKHLLLLQSEKIKKGTKILVPDPDYKGDGKTIRLIAKGKEDIKDTSCESSKACFDGKPIDPKEDDPKGEGDPKTAKPTDTPSTGTTVEQAETFKADHQLRVYPNPFENDFTIELGLTEDKMLTIEVFDLLGRAVYSDEVQGVKGSNRILVPFSKETASGVYQLKISDGQGMNLSEKLIRAH